MTAPRPLPERPGAADLGPGAWAQFEPLLVAAFEAMLADGGPGYVVLSLLDGSPDADAEAGCAPYVQFVSYANGTSLRAEIVGDAYLAPQYRFDAATDEAMRFMGWEGNDETEANWHRAIEAGAGEEAGLARDLVHALRDTFGITHPHLLVHRADGCGEVPALLLGLCAQDDVPHDAPEPAASIFEQTVCEIGDRDDLLEQVTAVLRECLPEMPGQVEIDDDGDLQVIAAGQFVWVRVHELKPLVEIFTLAVDKVRSPRDAAVEVGILNRHHDWITWDVRDRSVWQKVVVPASPFAPAHLAWAMSLFLDTLLATRADLALRLQGKAAR
ncbi:hypothetical protein GCM10022215_42520 [Nocardioides fonticola]|uniref:YbjN domain-containing protein n=1 Tax=Nocardioides fonticola TaxID=450363 RepID=A0ABP7Y4S9_9ACTN